MENIIFRYNKSINKPHNIFSVVAYRLDTNYKAMYRYFRGLRRLTKIVKKSFPNYFLYIFYDDSIVTPKHENDKINQEIKDYWLPLFDMLNRQSHVRLINYHHRDFSKGLYHDGHFGTFVRFMPLFDYDVFENVKNVIIGDIDELPEFYEIMKKANKQFIKSVSRFHFGTSYCYNISSRIVMTEKELPDKYKPKTSLKILGGHMLSKIKFPKIILDNFLNCTKTINSKSCEYMNYYVNILDKLEKVSGNETTRLKVRLEGIKDSLFLYGLDEFFLNTAFFKYIFEQKIPFSYSSKANFNKPLYNVYMMTNQLKDADEHIKRMFKEIMGKYYNGNKSLEENFKVLDDNLYHFEGFDHTKDEETRKKYEYFYHNMKKFTVKYKNQYKQFKLRKIDIDCLTAHKTPYTKVFVKYRYQ